jgi:hypothetical protein
MNVSRGSTANGCRSKERSVDPQRLDVPGQSPRWPGQMGDRRPHLQFDMVCDEVSHNRNRHLFPQRHLDLTASNGMC